MTNYKLLEKFLNQALSYCGDEQKILEVKQSIKNCLKKIKTIDKKNKAKTVIEKLVEEAKKNRENWEKFNYDQFIKLQKEEKDE